MASIRTRATLSTWPNGMIVDDADVLRFAISATTQYAGYADIISIGGDVGIHIDPETELDDGEWALIRPYLALLIEQHNAIALEASRSNGVEAYGRSSSEVTQDIKLYEQEVLPAAAFSMGPVTI